MGMGSGYPLGLCIVPGADRGLGLYRERAWVGGG